MKNIFQNILAFILFPIPVFAKSQTDSSLKTHHIAIFAPLYLDSAFDDLGNYRYDNNFPKFISPGLEFYEGALLAIDSLQKENAHLEINLYDTKSVKKSIQQVLEEASFQNTDLIIGYVSSTEMRLLAAGALHKNIPFVNINFPNDENIRNNKSLVILNTTLRTHCEEIYKFLQRNYGKQAIYVIAKNGILENRLKNYFADIQKENATGPLNLKFITLGEKLETRNLKTYLNPNMHTVFVAASLNEAFAKDLCFQLSPLAKSNYITVIGMPTWDNISDFSLPLYNGLEIMYTTPFYFNPNDSLVARVQQYFKTNFYMRASDMIFRGFQAVCHFAKLLGEHGDSTIQHLGEKTHCLFGNFNIQPVFINKQNTEPDYYENKQLYFIKKADGITSVINAN
ncbi:MAG: hypothetical protein JST47_01485 [Bacteroidetes bacterium]|nr:hypothetical protein [Bacteroidota bacterium]